MVRFLMLFLCAAFASPALAADKPAVPRVDAPQFLFSVRVVEGDKVLTSFGSAAYEGKSARAEFLRETAYLPKKEERGGVVALTPDVVKHGFAAQLTPRLLEGGEIRVAVDFQRTELLRINQCGDIQCPETQNDTLVQEVSLKPGQELAIPFGPPLPAKAGSAPRTRFTIYLTAIVEADKAGDACSPVGTVAKDAEGILLRCAADGTYQYATTRK